MMNNVIPVSNSADLTSRLWATAPKKKKEELLTSLGYHKSWARTKTMTELVNRGGGMVANSLHSLVKLHSKRNPGIKRVVFKTGSR